MSESIKFRLSENVSALTEEYLYYVPQQGTSVEVVDITAEIPDTSDCEVCVIWDYEGENEELLWTIKRSGTFNKGINIPSNAIDGIKKLALVLVNPSSSNNTISAFMLALVRTL